MKFEKYHGTGNDFIIFKDALGFDPSRLAQNVCNRHFGVGADGMMLVNHSDIADVKMVFYNADGSIAPMCGNGIRCFAKYVYDHKIVEVQEFSVETLAGIMKVNLYSDEKQNTQVTINLGFPNFDNVVGEVILEVDETSFDLSTLTLGTLHSVIFTNDLEALDIDKYGKAIECHSLFPLKINVNFVEVVDFENIKVSTFERGVGRTLSCGTGSAASAVVSNLKGFTGKKVNVHVPGGTLIIEAKDKGMFMTGPAELICKGEYIYKEGI
ncbi:MAG: diaminopimelate epimerase [Clostridia bacterium]|nr:diaminopimelate epimerase [Clostridia bacterium]